MSRDRQNGIPDRRRLLTQIVAPHPCARGGPQKRGPPRISPRFRNSPPCEAYERGEKPQGRPLFLFQLRTVTGGMRYGSSMRIRVRCRAGMSVAASW